MVIKSIVGITCAYLVVASINAHSVVLNTLNGIDYEWLELTSTAGLSRYQVELRLTDSSDALYGYEYASRTLVEDLFLSYSSWNGVQGWYGNPIVASEMSQFLNDFGTLNTVLGDGTGSIIQSIDGYAASIDGSRSSYALYGDPSECYLETCRAYVIVYTDPLFNPTLTGQFASQGWDASNPGVLTSSLYDQIPLFGSFLVKPAVVPVPGAAWLFGSGLFGLIGLARKKVRTKHVTY